MFKKSDPDTVRSRKVYDLKISMASLLMMIIILLVQWMSGDN